MRPRSMLFGCLTAFTCLVVAAPCVAAEDVSFRYEVLAALSKQGCSAGMCHGSPTGKGGFLLSLRGFDPEADYARIVKGNGGRRVSITTPQRSLLLRKPGMRVPHAGGHKLRPDDPAWEILNRWIAAGCPDDAPGIAACERIEFEPHKSTTNWPDTTQSLQVRATFADGTVRDVTHLTSFTSPHEAVATIGTIGSVTAEANGETTIVARYLDFTATTRLQFLRPVDGFAWNEPTATAPQKPELARVIDRLTFDRLRTLQTPPSDVCADSEFIRRAFLDVLGTLPERTDVEKFLADDSPDKRSRLIDRLLNEPAFADYLAQKLGDRLRVNARKLSLTGVHKFNAWLTSAVRDNIPYDRLARELLTAEGSSFTNPPAAFYRATNNPRDCAETISQLFLGVRIQCARCHNHPFDRWSQDNYYGLGAIFTRVQRHTVEGTGEILVSLDRNAELTNPRTNSNSIPWVPGTQALDVDAERDRRIAFANWLTSSENPFFARVAANRIWADLLGRGIVDPPDDFRADNPPSNPELLDALAREFAASGFDQKSLMRGILNSRVYQLSSRTNALNASDDRYFSHARARLLSAEQLLDAIGHVTGVPERFPGLPLGTRATTLPSPDFGNDFLKLFGQPSRNTVCDCERTEDPKLAQALQLINGPVISKRLRDRRSRLSKLFDNTPQRIAAAGQPPQSGLVAWFKADTGVFDAQSLPPEDGTPVVRWTSLVGEIEAVAPNAGATPVFVASSIGGMPGLRFDGARDLLHNTTSRLLPDGAPRTVIAVGQLADQSGGAILTFGRRRDSGRAIFTTQHARSAGNYYLYSDGVNGAGNTTAPAERHDDLAQPFVTTFESDGPGTKLRVFVNGTALTLTQPGGIGKDAGAVGFTIGSREDIPPGSGQTWNGDINEILVFNRVLDAKLRNEVGSYLATKYDLRDAYKQKPVPPNLASPSSEEIVKEFYFAALSRPPTESELDVARQHIESSDDGRQAFEDIAWALLNSQEFLFQH